MQMRHNKRKPICRFAASARRSLFEPMPLNASQICVYLRFPRLLRSKAVLCTQVKSRADNGSPKRPTGTSRI